MKNFLIIPEQKMPHFSLPSHTITWKRDLSRLKKTFTQKADLKTFLALYELAKINPKKGKKELEKLQSKYPTHPELLNLLASINLSLHKIRKANGLIEENYRKNPQYVFAKINFADLCLRRRLPHKIPEIFNQTFNLAALYPDRTTFHFSEFRGFMVLMGFYHLCIKKRKTAEEYHFFAASVDPNHPGTKLLGKKLYSPPFYKKIFSTLFSR